jgi:FkbM family methyltransferase
MSYRTNHIKFPYLSRHKLDDQEFLFMMTNERSESWYGNAVEANRQYLDLISPGDTVIDCGANEGFTSILAAVKAGPAGKVFAIEPAPHNLEPIRINVALNGFEDRVAVVPKAVGDKNAIIPFEGEISREGESSVEMIALDDTFSSPDVIKIDVEGFEAKVIRGAELMLKCHRPTIFLEPHLSQPVDMRNYGDSPEDLYQFVTDLGYVVYQDGRPIQSIPAGAVVLQHPDRKPRRTLIYTVAIGHFYREMAKLWKASLRKVGYNGDIIIYSGAPGDGIVEIPTSMFRDIPRIELLIRHMIGMLDDFDKYDFIIHMDCDCLALKPISDMFRAMESSADGQWRFTEMALTEGNRKYFLPDGVETPYTRGIGGAIFGARRRCFKMHCKQIIDESFRIKAWDMPCFDQNALNNLAARAEIAIREWPKEWACFSNIGSEPITSKTKLIHFTGDPEKKFVYMNNIMSLCK